MSLIVTSAPDGFRPVGGGDLIYEFLEDDLSGKTNYRLEIQFNGLGSTVYVFRPDASGVILANIAPILRSFLALSEDTAERLKNTYVKYQGVWDEDDYSQVELSSDVIYFFIGNNHYLNSRSKFHCTADDAQAGPPFSTYPTGVLLQHLRTSREGSTSFYTTQNRGLIGYVNRELRIELLHDDTLGADCVVSIISPEGNSIVAGSFDGSVYGMQSFSVVPLDDEDHSPGQWVLSVYSPSLVKRVVWERVTVLDEPCGEQVFLQWLNDYGGIERHLFQYNQFDQLEPEDSAKYLFKTLFAPNINREQWLTFSELLRGGGIYNDENRIGQLVQDITNYDPEDSGEPDIVNVIVSPARTGWESRRKKGEFQIQIRYPAIPNSEL